MGFSHPLLGPVLNAKIILFTEAFGEKSRSVQENRGHPNSGNYDLEKNMATEGCRYNKFI